MMLPRDSSSLAVAPLRMATGWLRMHQAYWAGVHRYSTEFMLPFYTALHSFLTVEADKLLRHQPEESAADYLELLRFNLQQAQEGQRGALESMTDYLTAHLEQARSAGTAAMRSMSPEPVADFLQRQATILETIVFEYPEAIRSIRSEFGFHFEQEGYERVAETDRFVLYRVEAQDHAPVQAGGKPVLIIPPYVLGANILAFLPGEQRSYAHAYANEGVPTYIRIPKPCETTPAVQQMSGEDDIMDTQAFCRMLRDRHGHAVTLNGFCQGGFMAMLGVLSGELDDVVDALITCVAPMDGSRSRALVDYMQHLPQRFRDLGYAIKVLPNGNRVVDGKVMSWVYKLKSIDKEAPLNTLFRDLMMFNHQPGPRFRISRTAAALNNWLIYDRGDLPEAITQLSFESYTRPVEADGTLPIRLFGRPLNFNRLHEKPIPVLLCYGEHDDLVDQEAALAPRDFYPVEVTAFPRGHGAIATSWSHPESDYALHKRFENGQRGPVRFHLDHSPQA